MNCTFINLTFGRIYKVIKQEITLIQFSFRRKIITGNTNSLKIIDYPIFFPCRKSIVTILSVLEYREFFSIVTMNHDIAIYKVRILTNRSIRTK